MLLAEAPKTESRWGLKAAVAATVIATVSLSWMAATKHSGDNKLTGELLAKATLPSATQFRAADNTEVQVFKLTVRPGGTGGWHSHSGPVIVNVTQGTASFYEAHGSSCSKRTIERGQAFVEQPGVIHTTRNDGKRDLIIHGVSMRPKGSQPGTWQVRPANCHH
ncbi:MAG: cupin [Acidimicrobiales bacterium]|nr:cupin [Acidimicrobiales bacterium]